jgi:hypothetical protein
MQTQESIKGEWLPITARQLAELCGQEKTCAIKGHGWVSNAILRGGKVFFTNQRGEKVVMTHNYKLFILS